MCSMVPAISTTPANEVWVPIEGYAGQYDISTFGRVRSNGRFFQNVYVEYIDPILLSLQVLNHGYVYVKLKGRMIGVHRLVAKAFLPNPKNLPQVNHKDENKSNNNINNLEWCSSLYNINYGTGIKRRVLAFGKRIEQLSRDGKHIAYYENVNELVRINNGKYHGWNVRRAASGERPTAYGYKWRYIE